MGSDEDTFDFKGENGMTYSLFSTNNLTVNGRITHDTFHSSVPGLTAKELLVHGSFFTDAYLNVAVGNNHSVQAAYKAGKDQTTVETVIDGRTVSLDIGSGLHVGLDGSFLDGSFSSHGSKTDPIVAIDFFGIDITGETRLQVNNGAWTVIVDSKFYPLREVNGDKHRLDIRFVPKTFQLGKVAPHGLIGQTFDFDGIAVDGARDNYDDNKVVTTRAMGEGAIEGTAKDYEISADVDPYSPAFKFSRWSLAKAAPRDISKLKGKKRSVKELKGGARGMAVEL
jgi:hypothetical protein